MKKSLFALLLALGMALSACTAPAADATPTPTPTPTATPAPSLPPLTEEVDLSMSMSEYTLGLQPEDAAMTVNGKPTDNAMYIYLLGNTCYYMDYTYQIYYGITPDFSDEALAEQILLGAQDGVLHCTVLPEVCETYGVTYTDEQRLEMTASAQSMAAELEAYGLTEEDYFFTDPNNFLYENLAQALGSGATQAEKDSYIEENGCFSVKHILLKTTTEDITDESGNVVETMDGHNTAQKALAEDLLSQLQSAEDMETLFDQLMHQHSEDGRDAEGILAAPNGYTFSNQDSLVGGFREATLALAPGELSGVVETDYGYHILLRTPLDWSLVEQDFMNTKADAAINAAKESAEVTVADPLSQMEVATFYARFSAYMEAVAQQIQESGE